MGLVGRAFGSVAPAGACIVDADAGIDCAAGLVPGASTVIVGGGGIAEAMMMEGWSLLVVSAFEVERGWRLSMCICTETGGR